MKLHFRGIEVPALGSPRDIVYRNYLIHESKVEAKKQELSALIAMASPFFTADSDRKSWDRQIKQVFDDYIALDLGHSVSVRKQIEADMQEFYDKVLKNSRPKLTQNGNGKFTVTNLPKL